MSYAEKYIKAHGLVCSINRSPIVKSKVSIKRSTNSVRDLGSRVAYWEGIILADTMLQSGEMLLIGSNNYLVQSVNFDPMSETYNFFAAKSNAILTHKRISEVADNNNNIVQAWPIANASVYAYGEVITAPMRQFDPGLLEQTRYIFQVPKSISAMLLDRIVFNDNNYEVVSIDDIGMPGIARLQLGVDLRPD